MLKDSFCQRDQSETIIYSATLNRIFNHRKWSSTVFSNLELKRTEDIWRFPFDPDLKTDRLISQKVEECSGSTACAILIDSDQIYCSNIGDSRAIASIGGESAYLVTFD